MSKVVNPLRVHSDLIWIWTQLSKSHESRMFNITAFNEKVSAYHHDPLYPEGLTEILKPLYSALEEEPDLILSSRYDSIESSEALYALLTTQWVNYATLLQTGDESAILSIRSLAMLAGRICLQENPKNQSSIWKYFEPHVRSILVFSSSFTRLEDPNYQGMIRLCCQALSNMVTKNLAVAGEYISAQMISEKENHMILRLLDSSDPSIIQALLILLTNVVQSPSQALLLATDSAGVKIFGRVLALVDSKSVEISLEDNDPKYSEDFMITYSFVCHFIRYGIFSLLYNSQNSTQDSCICQEKLVLLKFLESFLQSSRGIIGSSPSNLDSFLLALLQKFQIFLCLSQRPKDIEDALALEAVVLVLLSLCSMGQAIQGTRTVMCAGIVNVVAILRFLQELIPPEPSSRQQPREAEPQIVQVLSRTCVRFLGVAGYEQSEAQDEIRETGGLTLLLGMCQMNEFNPTLREHALFAIRNALQGNQKNQELIAGMKPKYTLGKHGELGGLPHAMR